MTEYTPSDDHMRSLFCQGYAQGDFDKHDQAWITWEKWLTAHDARVRREAERSALDGYADAEEDSFLALHVKGAPINAAQCTHAAMTAREYRDTHYPETED